MSEYLTTMTVKVLREITARMDITLPSRARKADIVSAIALAIGRLRYEADDMNATIDEAYADSAEKAGITLPAFLACKKDHARKGQVKIGGFWNCCNARPEKVIVFDDGSRQAVCAKEANLFSGTVEDLPAGADVECDTCKVTYRAPAVDESVCVVTGKVDCAERSCELHYMSAPIKLAPATPAVTLFTGRRYKEKYTHVVITITSEISFDGFGRTQVHYASDSVSDNVITVERLNMFYDEI